VFLHDRDTGETIEIPGYGWYAAISDNGRYIAFSSRDDNVLLWDSNGYSDVYVFDQHTERTTRVSMANAGGETNQHSFLVAISGDGKYVGFDSRADNLVPNDSNDAYDVFVTENPHLFRINPGLNDAWHNPDTPGQGFWITVYPDQDLVVMTWLTYDTERPPEGVTANLGDPGHRWFNALGTYSGNHAVMNINITTGGIFDTPTDVQHTNPPGSDGTIILTFDNCNSGAVEYDIPSINKQGIVPIRRVANDNIVICEALITD
jgi:WD40 repeat protein